jgi:hypothetical protein
MNVEDIQQKLALFEERVRLFRVPTINERYNSPLDYCELYRKRYLPKEEKNIALGAKITYLVPPTGKYAALGETALTDGLYGGATFGESWVGWSGIDGSFVVDLGATATFTSIQTDFLHQLGGWILLPLNVSYAVSDDGNTFRETGSLDHPEDRDAQVKFVDFTYHSEQAITARYIKVSVIGTKQCPHWHYGVGHPCWFFIDEIVVR